MTTTLAGDAHGMAVMDDAIQNSGGHPSIVGEGGGPVFVGPVGGDDGGGALVATREYLEKELGSTLVYGQVTEFVDLC